MPTVKVLLVVLAFVLAVAALLSGDPVLEADPFADAAHPYVGCELRTYPASWTAYYQCQP